MIEQKLVVNLTMDPLNQKLNIAIFGRDFFVNLQIM